MGLLERNLSKVWGSLKSRPQRVSKLSGWVELGLQELVVKGNQAVTTSKCSCPMLAAAEFLLLVKMLFYVSALLSSFGGGDFSMTSFL